MSMENTPKVPGDWGPSKTIQSAEAETNINNIVRKYVRTGQLEHISEHLGQYRDVSDIPDLQGAMNMVAEANSAYAELPAAVRKATGHNPGEFLPWLDNPDNFDQAVEWGLLPPKEGDPPVSKLPHAEPPIAAEVPVPLGTTGTTD